MAWANPVHSFETSQPSTPGYSPYATGATGSGPNVSALGSQEGAAMAAAAAAAGVTAAAATATATASYLSRRPGGAAASRGCRLAHLRLCGSSLLSSARERAGVRI